MLNQNKIVLMTKLASYEENDGKENVKIGKFFRADYIDWRGYDTLGESIILLSAVLVVLLIFGRGKLGGNKDD